MISAELLSILLLFLNLIPITLLVFIKLKLANREIKVIFSALIIAGMGWGNAMVGYRFDGWDEATRLNLIRFGFFSATVLANLFLAFFIRFTDNSHLFKKIPFWIISGHTLAVALSCFTGLVVTSFEITPDKIRFHYGDLYPWYVASTVLLEVYAIYLLFRSYRNAESEFLKFQLGVLLRYTALTFSMVIISNVAIPLFYKTSRYSFSGPFIALFFFLGVFRILFKGTRLYVLHALDRLLRTIPFNIQENLFAVREFIQHLKNAVLSPGEKSLSQLRFSGLRGETLALSLGKGGTLDAVKPPQASGLEEGGVPHKWLMGFWDTIRVLENDNRYLSLALIKAETIIQEKWLSDTVEKLPVRATAIFGDAYAIADYLPAISKNIADNLETFGSEICTLSRTAFRQMATIPDYAKGNQLIVFEGEPGSGKSSLAKAMNYFRFKKHNLTEIFCQNGNIPGLVREIEQAIKTIRNSREKSAVLVRNIEVLPVNMLSVFYPLVEAAADRAFLYFTSTPDYLRNLEGTADTLFHKFNQIKMEVPPLRRRDEDIFNLTIFYSAKYAKAMELQFTHISREFIEQAKKLSWQGNITELQNTLQRELLTNKPPLMDLLHLSDSHALAAPGNVLGPLERAERKVIFDHLLKNNFNKNRTRIELDITVNTLNAKILKYGIELPDQI